MKTFGQMLSTAKQDEIWKKYCGFLDLNMDEFMHIQERLLMEQIDLLSKCELGKKLMGNKKPQSVEEFRKTVPLTTYDDYADFLLAKREDVLPEKVDHWIETTWEGGKHPVKVAPYSKNMIKEHTKIFTASLMLATSEKREEFSLMENDRFFHSVAPLPYLTGLAPHALKNEIHFQYLPPIEESESLSFDEKNRLGFELAMKYGIDLCFGLSSILVRIGESFVEHSKQNDIDFMLPKRIRAVHCMKKLFQVKKLDLHPILPKDIWQPKGIVCAGTDTATYREKIEYYWGKKPLEIYGGTEITVAATETWGRNGLTFFPDVNFLEFIPEKEAMKSIHDKTYVPKTLLLNEIEPNKRYELVITKFKGGAFVRYRVGDVIQCVSLKDEVYNISIPQIKFVDRLENMIDLAGFTRITSNTINKAIKLSKYNITQWVACKELFDNEPILHIYLETDVLTAYANELKTILSHALNAVDPDFKSIKDLLSRDPLKVTVLKPGTFKNYMKTNHILNVINPDKEMIDLLMEISNQK